MMYACGRFQSPNAYRSSERGSVSAAAECCGLTSTRRRDRQTRTSPPSHRSTPCSSSNGSNSSGSGPKGWLLFGFDPARATGSVGEVPRLHLRRVQAEVPEDGADLLAVGAPVMERLGGHDCRVRLVRAGIEVHLAHGIVRKGQEAHPQRLRLVNPRRQLAEVGARAALVHRPCGTVASQRTEVSAVRSDYVFERLQDAPVVPGQGCWPRLRQLLGPELGTERKERAIRPGVMPKRFLERGVAFAHGVEC